MFNTFLFNDELWSQSVIWLTCFVDLTGVLDLVSRPRFPFCVGVLSRLWYPAYSLISWPRSWKFSELKQLKFSEILECSGETTLDNRYWSLCRLLGRPLRDFTGVLGGSASRSELRLISNVSDSTLETLGWILSLHVIVGTTAVSDCWEQAKFVTSSSVSSSPSLYITKNNNPSDRFDLSPWLAMSYMYTMHPKLAKLHYLGGMKPQDIMLTSFIVYQEPLALTLDPEKLIRLRFNPKRVITPKD